MPTARELAIEAARAREIADQLARDAAEAARAEEDARRPKMPSVAEGAPVIVAFTKYMSGREYNYAAVGWRVGRSVRWMITGDDDRRNWPGLLAFIGEANWPSLRTMITGSFMLPEGSEPAVVERMGAFGRVRATESVVEPLVDAVVPERRADGPNPGWGSQRGGY